MLEPPHLPSKKYINNNYKPILKMFPFIIADDSEMFEQNECTIFASNPEEQPNYRVLFKWSSVRPQVDKIPPHPKNAYFLWKRCRFYSSLRGPIGAPGGPVLAHGPYVRQHQDLEGNSRAKNDPHNIA